MNQIVPVERREQKGRGHAKLRKLSIGLALTVEMRYLILPHQGRHAMIAERNPLACVFQGRPDHMLNTCVLRNLRLAFGLGQFFLR